MCSAVARRAFKYRFYPTDSQAAQLSRTFGAVRKVYNLALEVRADSWRHRRQRITYGETSALLTLWKQADELSYLNEVSSVPLQQALRHLHNGFVAFWEKRAGHPRFKSRKRSRASAEYTRSGFRYRNGQLTIAKMTGPLNIVWSRPLPDGAEPSTVTVSCDSAGRWFVSLLCEDRNVQHLPPVQGAVGIDAGVANLVTLSTGEKVANPRHELVDRARLAKAQRAVARKAPGSRNRDKARRKAARVHARITDRRRDYLHQLTTRLVRENQTLVLEDITVRNMVKNHVLARAISDAAWREFRTMLVYKAAWYGREVVVIDRWFPSTKLCSVCGDLADRMPLDVRAWTCASCGVLHDRDINAAKNILAAGLAVTVCGDDVRPQRMRPSGLSSTKQKFRAREG
ncbi:RNA-guided endonuclease InsQ/TnpB family protein [Nocardia sp. NPDC050406]|uniref:RNA-guided endonuclease InsQ/TnpB family protein n=1 Tax=Nocardia sp. NPDC050406 TaxID=3364318 RepID=UPI00378D8C9D